MAAQATRRQEASGRARRMSERMIVLGIDPGTASTGYGVVARRGGRLLALDGGVVETRPGAPAERRLADIHAGVGDLLDAHAPAWVALRRPDHVVVLAGGVGYRLGVSAETLRHVPAAGHPVTLHAHTILRDDAIALFGFATEEERDLFLLLLGVQAIGPKVALAVLSGGPPRELLAALAAGDAARFQAVPGIGKRTAERIIVELREKVADAPAGAAITVTRGADPRLLPRDG